MSRGGRAIVFIYLGTFFAFFAMLSGFLVLAVARPFLGGGEVRHLLLSVLVAAVVLSSLAFLYSGVVGAAGLPKVVARLGLGSRPVPLELLVASLGVLGASFFLDGLIQRLGWSEVGALAELQQKLSALPLSGKLVAALALGFFPGVGEELFFRGYLLRRLTRLSGLTHGLLTSSVAFGFFHLDPVQSPAAALLGLYLGGVSVLTGSLWAPICAHAVNNAAATLFTMIELEDGAARVLALTGLVAAISALFVLRQRRAVLPRP
ncbi:MAG: CPBP family intramembrane metalloprotease [Deltaproteobacteria bacterium]|nr:CPBP family intramembrane metalloprotease [Deltaproteobacteria bacterium]